MNGNLAYKLEPQFEIIGGRVMMMASATVNHYRVARNILTIFDIFLRGRPCEPFQDGTALYLENDREEYKPDMMVVCDPDKVKSDGVHGAPDLVVEVLSPSTGRYDRGHKMAVYERHGVREYWLVEPSARTVEQYVLEDGRFVLRDVYAVHPDYMIKHMKPEEKAEIVTEFKTSLFEDLTIQLEDVFSRVRPEG